LLVHKEKRKERERAISYQANRNHIFRTIVHTLFGVQENKPSKNRPSMYCGGEISGYFLGVTPFVQ